MSVVPLSPAIIDSLSIFFVTFVRVVRYQGAEEMNRTSGSHGGKGPRG